MNGREAMGSKLGAMKIAAKKAGVSLPEYLENIADGLKWCYSCREWLSKSQFGKDKHRGDKLAAICSTCRGIRGRKSKINSPPSAKIQQQASSAVSYQVKKGNMPKISTCKCAECGKKAAHYHHANGYAKEHWLDVVPLCRSCHKKAHYE